MLFTAEAEARLAEQSFELWRWRREIVSLGTTPADEATDDDREAFLTLCPGVRERRCLLFLGRLHPKKGVDLLVHAFQQVAARWPAVDLVVAGPPAADHAEWLAAVRAEVTAAGLDARVHWPGMVTGAAKRGAFALCEAFVLPSHQENFGVAVAEALAAGRPVLLSTEINIAPEIEADGAGLMEPDTADGTLRLLERWLGMSAEEHAEMRAQALRTFAARYDIRRNAAKLGEVLQRVGDED